MWSWCNVRVFSQLKGIQVLTFPNRALPQHSRGQHLWGIATYTMDVELHRWTYLGPSALQGSNLVPSVSLGLAARNPKPRHKRSWKILWLSHRHRRVAMILGQDDRYLGSYKWIWVLAGPLSVVSMLPAGWSVGRPTTIVKLGKRHKYAASHH